VQRQHRTAAAAMILALAATAITLHTLGGGSEDDPTGSEDPTRNHPRAGSEASDRPRSVRSRPVRPAIDPPAVNATVHGTVTGSDDVAPIVHGVVTLPAELVYRDMLVSGCGTIAEVGDDGRFALPVLNPPCFVSVVVIDDEGRIDLGAPRQFTGAPADLEDGAFDFTLNGDAHFATLSAATDRLGEDPALTDGSCISDGVDGRICANRARG